MISRQVVMARWERTLSAPHTFLLIVIGAAQFGLQAIQALYLGGEMVFDAREIWYPLSQHVLAGDTALYVGTLGWDNKPPLWEFLNLLVALTGEYQLVFLLLVAIANVGTAVLLKRYLDSVGYRSVGVGASTAYLLTLPLIRGSTINVRSFAILFVLGSMLAVAPWKRGMLLGVAGMITQFSVFILPVVVYDIAKKQGRRAVLPFAVANIVVVVVSFGAVLAIWGAESLSSAIRHVFFVGDYVATSQNLNPRAHPLVSLRHLANVAWRVQIVLIPALIGGYVSLQEKQLRMATVSGALFLLPLAVRSLTYYLILPWPFLCVLGCFAFESCRRETREQGNRPASVD